MAVSGTQIMLLGGLAVAGFVVYKKFAEPAVRAEGAKQEARVLEDLTPEDVQETYEAATKSHAELLQPTRTSAGHMLFQPLDLSAQNPLSGFVAVVKELDKSLTQLNNESGRPSVGFLLGKDRGKPYKDPNVAFKIARIFFFNPATGREVAAWELKKHADLWMPDMQDAVVNTFVHAFNYACKINPRYDQWANTVNTAWNDASIPYWVDQCNIKYNVSM